MKPRMFILMTLALALTICIPNVLYSMKGYASEVSVNLLIPESEEDNENIVEIEKELTSTGASNMKNPHLLPSTGDINNNFTIVGSVLILLGGTLIWLKKSRKNY